jgi:hypothetical protein
MSENDYKTANQILTWEKTLVKFCLKKCMIIKIFIL